MKTIKIKRCAKLIAINFTKDYFKLLDKANRVMNQIGSDIRSRLKSGEFITVESGQYIEVNPDSDTWKGIAAEKNGKMKITHSKYKTFLNDIVDWENSLDKRESQKRELVIHAMERYASFLKRNRQKKKQKEPNIHFKGKNYPIKDSFASFNKDDKTVSISTAWGDITMNYHRESGNAKYINKDKFGMNISKKQKTGIIAVEYDVPMLYTPEAILSFDMNKDNSKWLAFNDGSIIPANRELVELFEKVRQLQSIINEKEHPVTERKLRNKYKIIGDKIFQSRRIARKNWKNLHRLLNSVINKIADMIIQKTIDGSYLLCIDSVATGASSGTFGQDHLIPTLITKCENHGIPFYVIPCANTSRRCSQCGAIHKESRKDKDTYECIECGFEADAQLNAATNIAFLGDRLLSNNVPYGNYAKRNVDKLIEKFSSQ